LKQQTPGAAWTVPPTLIADCNVRVIPGSTGLTVATALIGGGIVPAGPVALDALFPATV
jgi:hypothetical protein